MLYCQVYTIRIVVSSWRVNSYKLQTAIYISVGFAFTDSTKQGSNLIASADAEPVAVEGLPY